MNNTIRWYEAHVLKRVNTHFLAGDLVYVKKGGFKDYLIFKEKGQKMLCLWESECHEYLVTIKENGKPKFRDDNFTIDILYKSAINHSNFRHLLTGKGL